MPPLGPRRLAATNTAPVAHVRGGRKRARRSYLTKKTFEGITTLQMRWEIVNLYAYQGVRGWAELSRAPVLDGWSALTHSFDSPSPLCAPSTHGSCTGPHRHLGADALLISLAPVRRCVRTHNGRALAHGCSQSPTGVI